MRKRERERERERRERVMRKCDICRLCSIPSMLLTVMTTNRVNSTGQMPHAGSSVDTPPRAQLNQSISHFLPCMHISSPFAYFTEIHSTLQLLQYCTSNVCSLRITSPGVSPKPTTTKLQKLKTK